MLENRTISYEHVERNARNAVGEIVNLINQHPGGGILFVTGPLASGKSLVTVEVIRQLRPLPYRIAVGQPLVERADIVPGEIVSRTGAAIPAIAYHTRDQLQQLFARADVVVLDEIQFTPAPLQPAVRHQLVQFRAAGGWAVVTGLQYTSARTEFPLCAWLKAEATAVFVLTATCAVCGAPTARYSQRLVNGRPAGSTSPTLLSPSANVRYEPRCARCHQGSRE